MKNNLYRISTILSAVLLSSCGGGGDVAAGPATFSVVPSSVAFASLVPGDIYCEFGGGASTVVNIIGGTPPFRIVNTSPDYLTVDNTVVDGKNPQFTVVALNACSSKAQVLILDYHSKSTIFSLSVSAGPAATTTP